MATVIVHRGTTRGKQVREQKFTLLKGFQIGAASGQGFITVDGTALYGRPTARILVRSEKDFTISGSLTDSIVKTSNAARRTAAASKTLETKAVFEDDSIPDVETTETDEQVMERINRRFNVLDKLTMGARRGDIRAMFVTGAPGVGKTFGVEKVLSECGMIEQFEGSPKHYEIVSGAMTPIGMFMKLYEHADADHVLVFDDCDSVFADEDSLNLLKAALDTTDKRKIYWNSESKALEKNGVPNDFEFNGSIIFISNINFRKIRGERMRGHLCALMSRSHFLDLTVHTFREKMLRIKDLVSKGMMSKFNLSPKTEKEIMAFLEKNAEAFNELSLRTVIKLAGLAKTFDERTEEWQEVAEMSLMGNAIAY